MASTMRLWFAAPLRTLLLLPAPPALVASRAELQLMDKRASSSGKGIERWRGSMLCGA
jgi:hypothetical protein